MGTCTRYLGIIKMKMHSLCPYGIYILFSLYDNPNVDYNKHSFIYPNKKMCQALLHD